MSNAKRTGILTAGIVAAVLLAVFAIVVLKQAERSKAEIPVIKVMPSFQYVNQDGAPFGSPQMAGKVCIVDFMFTRCKTACPVMSREMETLYNAFAKSDEVQFVSITVDPDYDTLEVLKAYAAAHGVRDARWQFLHAPQDSVIQLSEQGFLLPADNLPMGHSPRFVLVDREGNIRGYFNALEGKPMIALREQIKQLLKEKPGHTKGLVSSAHAEEAPNAELASDSPMQMKGEGKADCCAPGEMKMGGAKQDCCKSGEMKTGTHGDDCDCSTHGGMKSEAKDGACCDPGKMKGAAENGAKQSL